jgi:voltage-gated potassium channel
MSYIEHIRQLVDDTDAIHGKAFAITIQILIVTTLIAFTIETLPDLSQNAKEILNIIEVVIVVIFTIEYILRVIAAEKKFAFIFSFYGLIDLLAVLPFYIASGLDLRAVKMFRMLRLVRIFKLLRYHQALNRFHRALALIKEELILFGFVAIIVLYLSAVGIYYFEHEAQPNQFKSVIHSLWWAVTTLTTVGYGDMFPITAGGKFFTFLVLIVGLGVVAIPAGLVASALSQTRKEEDK